MTKFSTSNPSDTRGDTGSRLPRVVPTHVRALAQRRAASGKWGRVRTRAASRVCNQSAGWEACFEHWRMRVATRSASTCSATKATWRELQECARRHGAELPSDVTPSIVDAFLRSMLDRDLASESVRDRLAKVRHVFSLAVADGLLVTNPAEKVIAPAGYSTRQPKRSIPLRQDELQLVFGSDVYNGRNQRYGGAGEASYWMPVIMLRTGMKAEEIAGLAVEDIVHDGEGGYCFNVVDRPLAGDDESPDVDEADAGRGRVASRLPVRRLMNEHAVRRVPVLQELIDLGLLRYRDWLQAQGHRALFPELRPGKGGRLSESLSRAFGQHLRSLGVQGEGKSLTSLRRNFAERLLAGRPSSTVVCRILGRATPRRVGSDILESGATCKQVAKWMPPGGAPLLIQPWRPASGVGRVTALAVSDLRP